MTSTSAIRYAYLFHFDKPVLIGTKRARSARHHFGTTDRTIAAEVHAARNGEHASAIAIAAYAQNVSISIGYAARTDHHPAAELTSAYARKHCTKCTAEAKGMKQDAKLGELLERSVEVKMQRRLFK